MIWLVCPGKEKEEEMVIADWRGETNSGEIDTSD